jgi:hypothetical protein
MPPGGSDVTGWAEARRLGHQWVGEEHVLIALSRLDGPAGDSLREAGATPERLVAALEQGLAASEPPFGTDPDVSPAFNPAYYGLRGRAEGLALAAGAEQVAPEHLLLAMVWRARLAAGLLHWLGIDRAGLVRSLAGRGVTVPPVEPEPLDLAPRRRLDVPYEHLTTIVRELPSRLPADAHFGFNTDHERQRAWIVVPDAVDAEPFVDEIVARAGT